MILNYIAKLHQERGKNMKAEEALVILLGRIYFDTLTKIRIYHIIKNGIDWYYFLNICIKNKILCLAYKSLQLLELLPLLPSIIRSNMEYHYKYNCKQNNYFIKASEPIISYFEKKGIIATPVKGLRFLKTIYSGDPGVRILSDIDFIASNRYKFDIHKFMIQSGYKIYLINNTDSLCSINSSVKSYFFIKIENNEFQDKLRFDFDFSYTNDLINNIRESKNPLYEFLYLCQNYFLEMHLKSNPPSSKEYNYMKLVDLHEYYVKYLTNININEINKISSNLNLNEQFEYTIRTLRKLYTDITI